jgi:hypothetical protein
MVLTSGSDTVRRATQEEHHMTETDERQELAELAELAGWQHRNAERTDYYAKAGTRVSVLWRCTAAISGGSLYHDDILTTTTRDLATVKGWLRR